MPSGWDVYYVVCLSAVLALVVPLLLRFISLVVSRNQKENPQDPAPEALLNQCSQTEDTKLGRRMNTRFFLGVNVSLLLITLALILIPCAAALKPSESTGDPRRVLVCILTIAAFSSLGLLYAARKGDLDWLRSYKQSEGERE